MMVHNSALGSQPGVEGWHRSGKRMFVTMSDGTTVTFVRNESPASLRAEAQKLRKRADVADAIAYDKEVGLWEMK